MHVAQSDNWQLHASQHRYLVVPSNRYMNGRNGICPIPTSTQSYKHGDSFASMILFLWTGTGASISFTEETRATGAKLMKHARHARDHPCKPYDNPSECHSLLISNNSATLVTDLGRGTIATSPDRR